jgi:hypothetical protein
MRGRYIQIAMPVEDVPAKQPSPPTKLRLHAHYPDGKPVTRLLVRKAESYAPHTFNAKDASAVRFASASATKILTREDGRYEVDPYVLVWADGHCRYLVQVSDDAAEAATIERTFYPAQSLTFRVTDADGRPAAKIALVPAALTGYINNSSAYSMPQTNDAGEISFVGLPPGDYAYGLVKEGERRPFRYVFATVTATDDTTVDAVFGPYPEGSGRALLDSVVNGGRSNASSIREAWRALSPEDQKNCAKAAVARLEEILLDVSNEQDALAEVARLAGARDALPVLKRLFLISDWNAREEMPVAIAELGGDDAVSFLGGCATDEAIQARKRVSALVAMNSIKSPASLAAWRELRDAAHEAHEVTPLPEDATAEDRVVEAVVDTLHRITGAQTTGEDDVIIHALDDAEGTARLTVVQGAYGGTLYHLTRVEGMWVVTEIGGTVVS